MHTLLRRSGLPLALLSAAALMPALLAPIPASAEGAGASERSAQRESRELQRASRAEERAARTQERRATREQERAARRAARTQERAARPSASRGSGGEAAAAAAGCRGTIEATAAHITAGETVTLFGKLTCPAGTSVAKRQVTVDQRAHGAGASSFSTLGVATTEEDGSYKLTPLAFDTNTTFRVRVGNHGARTVVKVAPVVTLSGPSPAAKLSTAGGGRSFGGRSARVTFNGTVTPADDGARVSLQVAYAATGEQWRTVGFADVGADGSYSVAHSFRTAGQASVRVLVHLHKQSLVAASEALTYEVAQAQNPKLTIQSSPAPIAYGQPVTISGTAAEAPAKTVTLLARTGSGDFAPAATATTDASGNYSFTEALSQSTYYRVSDADTRSTVLFVGVRRTLAADPLPSTLPAGQQVTFTGSVTPADEGLPVYAERENASGTGFHIVASASVDGAGTYSIVHAFTNAGSYVMRIRVPGGSTYQATTSAPFSFEVTPAPAAVLTPEAVTPASPAS
jgi:hypothetical protein